VCINSLEKFFSLLFGKPLFIDEARQLMETIFHSPTINNRQPIMALFAQLLRQAPFVQLADAGMNNDAFDFYRMICGNSITHVLEATPVEHEANHLQLESFDVCRYRMLDDLRNNKKIAVGCTAESEAQLTRKFLIKNGIKRKRIVIVTGGEKSKEVKNFVNNVNGFEQSYDVVIYTSALGTGVSLEMPSFESTYLLCSNVLASHESLQMLARNRCAKNVYLAFGNQSNKKRVTDLKLLRQGKIEQIKNFITNGVGMQFGEQLESMLYYNTFDHLVHVNQVKINQDLNDFANNFLFLAEMQGRKFVKVKEEREVESTKKLAQEMKEEIALEIQSAAVIDDKQYHALDSAYERTPEEALSMKRHEVCGMTGLPNTEAAPPELSDVKNYMEGYEWILANFELLSTSKAKLEEWDRLNYEKRSRTKCLTSRQKIFKAVLKPLLKAQKDGGTISHSDLMKAFEVIRQYAPELAADFGDYRNTKATRVASTIRNFVKKFGYKLENVGRESTGQRHRTYEIKVMADIERYAANRKGLKR